MKDCLKKALLTFVQTAAGFVATNFIMYVGTDFSDINVTKSALFCLLMSAVAAGLSAVSNLPKKSKVKEETPTDE